MDSLMKRCLPMLSYCTLEAAFLLGSRDVSFFLLFPFLLHLPSPGRLGSRDQAASDEGSAQPTLGGGGFLRGGGGGETLRT